MALLRVEKFSPELLSDLTKWEVLRPLYAWRVACYGVALSAVSVAGLTGKPIKEVQKDLRAFHKEKPNRIKFFVCSTTCLPVYSVYTSWGNAGDWRPLDVNLPFFEDAELLEKKLLRKFPKDYTEEDCRLYAPFLEEDDDKVPDPDVAIQKVLWARMKRFTKNFPCSIQATF